MSAMAAGIMDTLTRGGLTGAAVHWWWNRERAELDWRTPREHVLLELAEADVDALPPAVAPPLLDAFAHARELPQPFHSADLAAAANRTHAWANRRLRELTQVGALRRELEHDTACYRYEVVVEA